MAERDDPVLLLTGWMENLEGAPGDVLREIRRDLGHDVERSEMEFLEFLRSTQAGKGGDCPTLPGLPA